MNLPKSIFILFMLAGSAGGLRGQDLISLNGYLSDMQSLYHMDDQWLWENTLHNRMNLNLYPAHWLTASIQLRNRFITGNTLRKIPGYSSFAGKDAGWMDLSWSGSGDLGEKGGYLFSSMVDRLWLQFSLGNLEIKAGRQRINWGQTFVWNPNDIFNSYSYFEVDYPERPGSDALRIQYYTGVASSLELAAKIDSAERVTAAGYFRFNTLGYDLQLLGGIYQEEDLVLGTGWSGNLGPAAFRGEFSYFRDLEQFSDTTGYLMASAALDYTFSNSLWIQVEGLYSAFAKERNIYSFLQFYSGNLDVKSLGFTEWSFFASVSYPVSPLLSGNFAGIWYPEWKGCYLGPSLDLSLLNNLDLSLIFQFFSARLEDPPGGSERENGIFTFLRLKWNF